jgi:glycosyltransferase involved in cell wall biosynthesis
MLVTTNITNDPRVMKEATALAQAGYTVQVIGVCITGTEPVTEVFADVAMQRLDLWHMRLSRWVKARRTRQVTKTSFDITTLQTAQPESSWRDWLIQHLYQVHYAINVLTIFWAYFFAALGQQADVYHAHDVDTLLPALLVGWWRQKPVVYDSHEYWCSKRPNEFISNLLIRWIERLGTPRCTHVFTVNRSIAERIAMHYRIAVPTVLMNVPADVAPLQPPTPLQDNQPVELLYHGRYFAHRGLEPLITAMTLVKAPVHLTLRGNGTIELALRAQVESLGLQSKVTFAPIVPMNQLVKTSTSCHIGIIPFELSSTFYLSLPNKLFEYMAAGLSILTNNLPEIAAIVNKHQIGAIYDSDDPMILAQAIDELASDRIRLEQYRQRAWRVYHEHFTWKEHQQVLLDVYAGLSPK